MVADHRGDGLDVLNHADVQEDVEAQRFQHLDDRLCRRGIHMPVAEEDIVPHTAPRAPRRCHDAMVVSATIDGTGNARRFSFSSTRFRATLILSNG